MSAELKDFRGKITIEADCVLEAINRVTGRERSEIAREVLHRWALEEIDKHSVLTRLLRSEGLLRPPQGVAVASEGISGSRRP
jgi:hypothetical protein